ncbi:hypothetical protein PG985_013199 [Apiospora marii]|uniref:NACHT-NTPase and P-loop NTPases N-terminal domain-containing protein n=1 Tax=Apiospora marii TaxID=335849 RepID=A0ABR1R8E1_9PEZI
MEVIGTISAAIGFVETAWKVKLLWDDFNDAPSQVQKLRAQCKTVEGMLRVLKNNLLDNSGNIDMDKSAALEKVKQLLKDTLAKLNDTVAAISDEVEGVNRKSKATGISRTKYLFKKESTFTPLLVEMKEGEARIAHVVVVLTK